MKSREEILTFCPICAGHCSAKVTVEDGKIVKWEQDMESGLPSEPCPTFKGIANIEVAEHPDRLKHPLKRVGARGEGKWERISWDKVLDTIAKKFSELKEKYGPESVAVCLGEPKGMEFAIGQRFATAFGTPNVATPSHLCGAPQQASAYVTFGPGYPCQYADMEHLPRLVVVWGFNIVQTGGSAWREWLRAALLNGAKLVVIDPKRIDIAKRADLWIRPRPGSDGALAMGLIKVIIEGKLYDEDFVAKWTVGFDELREEVKTFTLDDVEKQTWVPRQQIEKLARLYAQLKPAAIPMQGGTFSQSNTAQTARALLILEIITGNIPAWGLSFKPADYTRPGRFFLLSKLPRKAERTLGNQYKWAMMTAYIPYEALTEGILKEKEYPVKAALLILTNPLCSYPNARKAYQAFMKLDFIVVSEIFMTPTATMADIVLPAATSGEHDTVGYWGEGGILRAYPKFADPPGEAWPDVKIVNELAKRLGLREYFWDNETEIIDYMLQPSGLTWDDFKQQRVLLPKVEYRKREEYGFGTPSGKAEIYSKQAKELFGFSPIPLWGEVSRLPFEPSKEYPLLLTTRVEDAYKLTGDKWVTYQRKYKPQPLVELNPETAKKAGLKDGEWVYIETKLGRITQKLSLDPDLDPRVVYASWGWWFPEEPFNLFQWDKSNANILIDDEAIDPTTGSVQTRGTPCRVYRV